MLPLIGAGLGIAESLASNFANQKDAKYKRFKEKGVEEAEQQTAADRERILSLSPVTNAKMKQKAIQDAGAAGLAVAGNAGGGAANSGMGGGDVSSGAIQGAKASQYTGQVANQTGAQLAGTYDAMAGEQNAQNAALQQNTMQKAQIADMVTYDRQDKEGSIFAGLLGAASGGAGVITEIAKLGLPTGEKVEAPDISSLALGGGQGGGGGGGLGGGLGGQGGGLSFDRQQLADAEAYMLQGPGDLSRPKPTNYNKSTPSWDRAIEPQEFRSDIPLIDQIGKSAGNRIKNQRAIDANHNYIDQYGVRPVEGSAVQTPPQFNLGMTGLASRIDPNRRLNRYPQFGGKP